MKVHQVTLARHPTPEDLAPLAAIAPQLVLVFGSVARLTHPGLIDALKTALPGAQCVGCTVAGEIGADGVTDEHLVISALHFAHPQFKVVTTRLASSADSLAAGEALSAQLAGPDLHHVLVFAPGVGLNGTRLIEGMSRHLPPQVSISGGLAGDGAAFKQTYTLSNTAVSAQQLVAVGIYAPQIQIQHGCAHGWQPFGPPRKITRCAGNVLYALDGAPALEVYKRYLGDYARELPASGLFFPFELLSEDLGATGLIRTVLGVDETEGSLTLAGDVHEGAYMKLMHASTDALVQGAQHATEHMHVQQVGPSDSLALLVSCVGRKLVMGARVEEEVDAVRASLLQSCGRSVHLAGFYSYGELCPRVQGAATQLHNQTMTVTHIQEVNDEHAP